MTEFLKTQNGLLCALSKTLNPKGCIWEGGKTGKGFPRFCFEGKKPEQTTLAVSSTGGQLSFCIDFFWKNTMKKSLSLAAGFRTGRGSPVWPCATKKNSVSCQKWFLAKVLGEPDYWKGVVSWTKLSTSSSWTKVLGEPDYFVRKINKWIHTCINK